MPRTLNNEVDIQNIAGLDNDIRDSFTRAMLSEDENVTGVAARDYDINEFFIHSDRYLYKALTAITQGDTIVPGTNAQKFTVSEALYELYAQSADSIRDLLSNVEEGANASRNFVAGEEIIWTDGFLYKVLTTVTSGTAWDATSANKNIELAANLTSQIQTLANSLATETTNRKNADSAIIKNGAMNLAPNNATTQVVSGVTFSIDKTNSATNGIITLSGTASEAITLVLGKFKVPIGSYVLSSKADGSKARVTVEAYNGNTWKNLLASTVSSDDVSFNVDYSNYDTLWISVRIDSGTNVNGVVVKPMVSVIAGEYVPYAKTNRELTENTTVKKYHYDNIVDGIVTINSLDEYIYGKITILRGLITLSQSCDKSYATSINLSNYLHSGTVDSNDWIGSNDNNASGSDRTPLSYVRISNKFLAIGGAQTQNRGFNFTITFINNL